MDKSVRENRNCVVTFWVFLIFVFSSTDALSQEIDFNNQGPALGEPFPAFDYVDLNGDSVRSENLKDQIVVINIWFVGCKGCKQEEPYLRELVNSYSVNDDIVFLSFCMSPEKRIRKYYQKNGDFGYQTISLTRKEVGEKFDVITSPMHFVISKGILTARHTGPLTPQGGSMEWMKNELIQLQANQ